MLRTIFFPLALFSSAFAQSHKLSVAGGYNYQNSDQGHGLRTNLHGWFGSAQFDLSSRLSLSAEDDNYYGSVSGQSTTQQNFVLGPQLTLRSEHAKWRPFFYVQAGDQRSASAGSVEHAFDLQAGGGIEVKLSDKLQLQVSPGEYNLALPSAGATHSYSVKVGLSWIVWKQTETR